MEALKIIGIFIGLAMCLSFLMISMNEILFKPWSEDWKQRSIDLQRRRKILDERWAKYYKRKAEFEERKRNNG